MHNRRMLAIDLGASSGRGIIGTFDGKKITLNEIHRFSNDPVETGAGFFWDTLRLLFEIKTAILKSAHSGGIDTIGIDTWGVDYGYIDRSGALLGMPYQYRDPRTFEMMDKVYETVPYSEMYRITGIESMYFNTVFQIAADLQNRPWLVEDAERLLLTPDLLAHFLTGETVCEYTMASTTSLLNAESRTFSSELLDRLSIPDRLFSKVVLPGSKVGTLLAKVDEETGYTGARVVNIASHDTASAVIAVPAESDDFLFISSGTWSLMGIESSTPIINDTAFKYRFTNEGGAFGKINVMKNIMGLWLIQESRRQWAREGTKYSFDELAAAALDAAPLRSIIDPDDESFATAGNIPERIREFCRETNQNVPSSVGEIARCIYESLALRYRFTAEKLTELSGRTYPAINIVGGGTKEKILCQFTADASGRRVIAGPTEATALGNIVMQAAASGEIGSAADARTAIRNSFELTEYTPAVSLKAMWDDAYLRFLSVIGG